MRVISAVLLLMALLSCGDDGPELNSDSLTPTPTWTASEKITAATSVALAREPFSASENCKLAREQSAGSDFVTVEQNEQGWPAWEERFLDVDVVVRAKLHSSHSGITSIRGGKDGERHYPAIAMNFRVFEIFKGSVVLDYIVVWQVGWDYYRSHADAAQCVRPEDVAALREEYAYLDDRESILFLKRAYRLEWLDWWIPSSGDNYFLARLPSGLEPADLLEDEQWRWLPHYDGDSFYNKKYSADSLDTETKGTVTTQELREVGDKIEELQYTHDLDCVYEAYKRARNFDENLEELMMACTRE